MPWKPSEAGEVPTLGWYAIDWITQVLAAPDRAEYEPFRLYPEQEISSSGSTARPEPAVGGTAVASSPGHVAGASRRCWPPLRALKRSAMWS